MHVSDYVFQHVLQLSYEELQIYQAYENLQAL